MTQLTNQDVDRLSDLSKIELTNEEKNNLLKDINDILIHVSKILDFVPLATESKYPYDSQVKQDTPNVLDFDLQTIYENIPQKSSDNSVKVSKVIKK